MEIICKRIEKVKTHYCGNGHGSVALFAKEVGEKLNVVSNWLSREATGINVVLKIHNRYPDVNLDWLITGRGEMELSPQANAISIDTMDKAAYQSQVRELQARIWELEEKYEKKKVAG